MGGAVCAASVDFSEWTTQASELSSNNMMRCQTSGDLLKMTMVLYQILQGLSIAGVIPDAAQLHMFALLDLLQKLGVSHIMCKSGSVLRRSAQHLQVLSDLSRGRGEPQLEPPPRNEGDARGNKYQ